MPDQKEPIWKLPTKAPSKPENGAAFIFLHGFDDDAMGVENIADQLISSNRFPHLTWVLPNAPVNRDAMATAWYAPTGMSPVPPSRPELAEDEDEDGLMRSQRYVETLVEQLHASHRIPLNRIVLGGFSQGCAQSLLLNVTSEKYAGKLAGVVGLMGYLPLGASRIAEVRQEHGLEGKVGRMEVLLARGLNDRLIPGWVWRKTVEDLGELGVEKEGMSVGEYEGVGHTVSGRMIGQVSEWLRAVVPDLEA